MDRLGVKHTDVYADLHRARRKLQLQRLPSQHTQGQHRHTHRYRIVQPRTTRSTNRPLHCKHRQTPPQIDSPSHPTATSFQRKMSTISQAPTCTASTIVQTSALHSIMWTTLSPATSPRIDLMPSGRRSIVGSALRNRFC